MTEVEIFGAVYPVRGDHDEEHLREIASRVDRTMRAIAERIATGDTNRIAILAALNLADELVRCQKDRDRERTVVETRVEDLVGRLADALEGAAD